MRRFSSRSVWSLSAVLLLPLAALLCAPSARAQAAVALTPSVVQAGSPELIQVHAPSAATVTGEWLGRKLEFFRGRAGEGWFALAGADVETPVGPSTLSIDVRLASRVRTLTRTIPIRPAHYRTSSLSVAPRFISPTPEQLKAIKYEIRLKDRIFSVSAPRPLWVGDFRAPVHVRSVANFGARRIFNGKLASVHKGMDFLASRGTPVHASNSGVVVLAERLYFEGNCVVIDHGLGLYTIAMHLSRIDVHQGEHVAKGQMVGLSGATGRVTGPHLHWAVRWQNAYLDPAKLLRMNLRVAR